MNSAISITTCSEVDLDAGKVSRPGTRTAVNGDVLIPNDRTKLLGAGDNAIGGEGKVHWNRRRLGFVALFCVIWTNIFQAESVQYLQGSINFKKPFFIMCLRHAAPVVILPLMLIYYRLFETPEDQRIGFDLVHMLHRHSIIPLPKLLRLSAFFGVFYLVTDYFWFSSFKNLTVATGATIFNCSPLFVYCFSICLLHEKASARKFFGVLTSFVGVTMVVLNQGGGDTESDVGGSSILAALMMLTAAAMSAMFQVTLNLFAGEDINNISTFIGFPFPSLYEPIGFPPTAEGNLMLWIATVMFSTNFVFLTFAVCWTSPLETSVGFMLTIPLSGLMDTLMHSTKFTWECIVGSVLVMTGFLILELSSTNPPTHHSHEEESKEKAQLV